MSPNTWPGGARVGCVSYLNAGPLIYGYGDQCILEHPSRLAAMLLEGDLDAALVPSVTAFTSPGFILADGICIGCDGPVYSVILVLKSNLSQVRRVYLDEASRTSASMLRWLLRDRADIEWVSMPSEDSVTLELNDDEAAMLIGNQANHFRSGHEDRYRILDLGEWWKKQTGLPFVFAVWMISAKFEQSKELAEVLRVVAGKGIASIRETYAGNAFAIRYLTEFIHFNLDASKKSGLAAFRAACKEIGIARGIGSLEFA